MGEAACRVAAAAGYVNAGTIEFLVDQERHFYFLEMNTRLQVEHPVTEMVTGLDLVKEQLRIAAGEKLGYDQDDVSWRGWAIECRIYAEDPSNNFLPSPGRITRLRVPSGPWVRDDSGVYEGCEVPIHYDPLISKLVVWGRDREEAIHRMTRALDEYQVGGIQTTLPFHRRVMGHPDFAAGRLSTHFVETKLKNDLETRSGAHERTAIIAAALHAYQREQRLSPAPAPPPSPWRFSFRPGSEPESRWS
jgi:acetyl/propionyl-CoA carboxylase alpha subunit